MFVDKEDMKEVDKIWVRGEIANKLDDLKIRESERSFNSLVNGLDTRIARVEGQISAPSRPPHPWITPVIALVGTALIAFQGWMGVTLVQHGNKLSGMQGSLLQLGITVAANDPTSSKGQSEARVALADARKLKTSIPVAAVQEAGKSFFEAAKSAPKAWDVALDFISYRTLLNARLLAVGAAQQIATTPIDAKLTTHYVIKALDGYPLPKITVGGDVSRERSATMHELGAPAPDEGQPRGKEVILIEGGAISLDNILMRHVVVRNSAIFYSGGPTQLDDVIFVNCSCPLKDDQDVRNFAMTVLLQPSIVFQKL